MDENCIEILSKYFSSKSSHRHEWNIDMLNSINASITAEIIGERFKRQLICNNDFNRSLIKYNAFSGSTFINVFFNECHLSGNGFIGAVFKNVSINSKKVRRYSSNNWSQTYFNKCLIHNAHIRSCTISQSLFLETDLTNIKFSAVTFENTLFKRCIINNVDFSNVNIDFMEIDKCNLNRVKFSFFSLPFVFGGLNALSDDVSLVDGNDQAISSSEYIKVLPYLANYFISKKEYFAACNINLFLHHFDEALSNLNDGILRALEINDFRMVKYYCKLGVMGNIIQDVHAQKILNTIEKILFNNDTNKSNLVLNEELMHYGEIRTLLINRTLNKNKVEMVIKTKILSEQQEDINLLLNTIDDVLTSMNLGEDKNFIQIRHNSPVEIFVTYICQSLSTILGVTSSILSIVASFITIKSLNKKYKKETPEKRKNLILNEISKFGGIEINNPTKIINLRLDLACANLKNTLKKAKKNEIDQIIDNFTACIQNVTSEELPNDILLIKFNDNNF